MKRLLMALSILMISLNSLAQKISNVEIDKFTGKKRIETNSVPLKSSIIQSMSVYLRSNGDRSFLHLSGKYMVGIVGTTDPLIFLFQNKDTVMLYPTSIQSTNGYGTDEYYSHQYYINTDQLNKIKSNTLVSLRRYYGSNYGDLEIDEKRANKLMALAGLFDTELNKN